MSWKKKIKHRMVTSINNPVVEGGIHLLTCVGLSLFTLTVIAKIVESDK